MVFCGGEGCSLARSDRDEIEDLFVWCMESVRGPYGVCLWKFIHQGWVKFDNFISFKMGNGTWIHFLHDLWCGKDGIIKLIIS